MKDVVKSGPVKSNGVRRRPKRKRNLSLYYIMIFMISALILFILSRTVLFRINEYKVSGVSRYTIEQILSAGDLSTGKNMFSLNIDKTEEKIKKALIYVENINIRRKLPDTLIVEVEEAIPYACCEYEGTRYAVISRNGRYLETEQQSPREELLTVIGMDLQEVSLGADFKSSDANKKTILMDLISSIDEICPGKIKYIDITDRTDIVMGYDGRIDIEFGSSLDYKYKLRYITAIIEDSLEPDATGRIIYHSAAAGASFVTEEGLEELEQEKERYEQEKNAPESNLP